MLIYQIIITLGISGLLLHLLVNLFVFRRPQPGADGGERISVLIPARNEADCIGACLESLVRQKVALHEILVLDDHSEDGTAEVVAAWGRRCGRVHWRAGKAIPEGWTGKCWACHQLAQAATGDLLVFTDADTIHDAECIGATARLMRRKGAGMVSLWPYQETVTLGEKLVVPFVHILLLVFLPHWMPGRWRSLGAANGQFLAFRRRDYDQIGGHEAVRQHVVEDISLARLGKVAGLKVVNADGCRLIRCRMYKRFAEVWEGFSKNLRAGSDGSVLSFFLLQGVQIIFLFFPFIWLPVGVVSGASWVPLAVLQVIGIYLLRLVLVARVRHSLWGAVFHPVGQAVELAIALNSWIWFSRGQIAWKGRSYPVNGSTQGRRR